MIKSSEETTISTKELNKILPSYLLKEVEEDTKVTNLNEKSKFKTNFNGKVSNNFFRLNFKLYLLVNYLKRIQIKMI